MIIINLQTILIITNYQIKKYNQQLIIIKLIHKYKDKHNQLINQSIIYYILDMAYFNSSLIKYHKGYYINLKNIYSNLSISSITHNGYQILNNILYSYLSFNTYSKHIAYYQTQLHVIYSIYHQTSLNLTIHILFISIQKIIKYPISKIYLSYMHLIQNILISQIIKQPLQNHQIKINSNIYHIFNWTIINFNRYNQIKLKPIIINKYFTLQKIYLINLIFSILKNQRNYQTLIFILNLLIFPLVPNLNSLYQNLYFYSLPLIKQLSIYKFLKICTIHMLITSMNKINYQNCIESTNSLRIYLKYKMIYHSHIFQSFLFYYCIYSGIFHSFLSRFKKDFISQKSVKFINFLQNQHKNQKSQIKQIIHFKQSYQLLFIIYKLCKKSYIKSIYKEIQYLSTQLIQSFITFWQQNLKSCPMEAKQTDQKIKQTSNEVKEIVKFEEIDEINKKQKIQENLNDHSISYKTSTQPSNKIIFLSLYKAHFQFDMNNLTKKEQSKAEQLVYYFAQTFSKDRWIFQSPFSQAFCKILDFLKQAGCETFSYKARRKHFIPRKIFELQFSNLTCLCLTQNKIISIENIAFLNALTIKKIDLSLNFITNTKSLNKPTFKNLMSIILRGNKIKNLTVERINMDQQNVLKFIFPHLDDISFYMKFQLNKMDNSIHKYLYTENQFRTFRKQGFRQRIIQHKKLICKTKLKRKEVEYAREYRNNSLSKKTLLKFKKLQINLEEKEEYEKEQIYREAIEDLQKEEREREEKQGGEQQIRKEQENKQKIEQDRKQERE